MSLWFRMMYAFLPVQECMFAENVTGHQICGDQRLLGARDHCGRHWYSGIKDRNPESAVTTRRTAEANRTVRFTCFVLIY